MKKHLLSFATFALALVPASIHGQSDVLDRRATWDTSAAEHLFNRAAFGARPGELEYWVDKGRDALIEDLFRPAIEDADPFYVRLKDSRELRSKVRGMSKEDRQAFVRKTRREDARQLRDYLGWWYDRLLDGQAPITERMVLFWHGYFTSSYQDVKNSHEMIVQNQLFREYALGDFDELLRKVARDPAMLEYLDNDDNKKGKPNENFARELMELFTLGEGHYTEIDVKEAARAFTGWTDRFGEFTSVKKRHDRGVKTVLGRTGRLDGDDVIDVLLAHPACARYLATKLLTYFEGIEPGSERVARYAQLLRDADWNVGEFLRALFSDPEFYRDEIRGARISSPIDYLVGSARRLGVDVPEGLVAVGSSVLGERLFFPPNVKGWEGGRRWVTTSTLMLRGNVAGLLTGSLKIRDLTELPAEDLAMAEEMMDEMMAGEMMEEDAPADPKGTKKRPKRAKAFGNEELRMLRAIEASGWSPRMNLTARLRRQGARTDAAIVDALGDELLAVTLEAQTRAELLEFLAEQRHGEGLEDGALLDDPFTAEPLLRRLAHLLLSSPEAQLH